MKRSILPLLTLLLALCFCTGCGSRNARRDEADRVLAKSRKELTVFSEAALQTKVVPEGASFPGVEAIACFPPQTVEFLVGSGGLTPSASYYGFYYSPGNMPMGYQGADMDLTPEGQGWSWHEDGGDNRYYTERLEEAWFYYEMSF